ncbi:hypothetical protein CAPTEDRAFT_190803 [Capitella teleta]|uniref:Uncharacterized protein n=1 Tax=Capitella teleta TaxID=283909 RepID=R7UU12_CAPTE|nr:hypothetical protein CAPTEDRAFT_190803 [Capitella teleta]|eukprot:ELU09628.1 hypothetical protein CAPTEDRAFT_190803 [Capitella teleta]
MAELSWNGEVRKSNASAGQENTQDSDGSEILDKKAHFAEYAANATIHGLRNTVDPAIGRVRRILWVLLLVGFAGYLILTIIFRVQRYITYPVASKMQMIETDIIALPAMTICNINMIRKSYAEKDELIKNVFLGFDIATQSQSNLNISDPKVAEKVDAEYDYHSIFIDGGYQLQDMIDFCMLNSSLVTCSDYFTTISTPMGNCFTFQSMEFIQKKGRLVASQSGVEQGLSITVNISQDEYFYQKYSYSAGIRVMRMPPPYGDNTCIDIDNSNIRSHLKYFDEYTKSGCIEECNIDFLISSCQCVPHMTNIKNVFKTNREYLNKCKCHDPCIKTSYQVTKSEASYPSEKRIKDISTQYGIVNLSNLSTTMRKDRLALTLYISEMNYNLYKESSAYSIGDFQSDVGGNLGLCLGASFLSLAELMEYFIFVIFKCAHNFPK